MKTPTTIIQDEIKLIELYRQIPDNKKEHFLVLVKNIVKILSIK